MAAAVAFAAKRNQLGASGARPFAKKATGDCDDRDYTNRTYCEARADCLWCEPNMGCAPRSYGPCCGGDNTCSGAGAVYCTDPSAPLCSVRWTGGAYNCSMEGCCTAAKPEICHGDLGNFDNTSCYDPKTEKCCTTSAAPLNAECCSFQENEGDFQGGAPWCPEGMSCCQDATDSYGKRGRAVCCHTATEECHVSNYGNFCSKKNDTAPCNDNLNEQQCVADVRCQMCAGRCLLKSAGECCSPQNQCTMDPVAVLCRHGQVCSHGNQPFNYPGNCTTPFCCPASAPSYCPAASKCYDPARAQCCPNGLGSLGYVCCSAGTCPLGSWCCGHTTLACCNASFPVCNNNHFVNRCEPGQAFLP